jgi:GntR family transcriptional regulator
MVLEQGPTPLYYQLKNILKARILSNELKGSQRLPTEAELCVEYNVSRITVRQALSELMKDGLIYRDRGRGTFVTEGAEFKRPELKGSIENLIVAAKGTHTRVLSYQEIVPPPAIAKIFQLKKPEKVFQLQLVRFTSKAPLGYSYIYFPYSLGKTVSPEELNGSTEIITFVEEKLKTKAHRAKQAIDVGVADKVLAENLSVKPETPLLIIQRDYYTRKGTPMFVAVTYFRPDVYKYEIELTRT